MKDIQYRKGDATAPQSENNKIIVHVCNGNLEKMEKTGKSI